MRNEFLPFDKEIEGHPGRSLRCMWGLILESLCAPLLARNYQLSHLLPTSLHEGPSQRRSCLQSFCSDRKTVDRTKHVVSVCASVLKKLVNHPEIKGKFWEQICRIEKIENPPQVLSLGDDEFDHPGSYMEAILKAVLKSMQENKINRFALSKILKESLLPNKGAEEAEMMSCMKIIFGLLLKMRFTERGNLNTIEHEPTKVVFDILNRANTKMSPDKVLVKDAKTTFSSLYSVAKDCVRILEDQKLSEQLDRPVAFDTLPDVCEGPPIQEPIPIEGFSLKDENLMDKFHKELVDELLIEPEVDTRRYHCSLVLRELSKIQQADSMICFVRHFSQKLCGLLDMVRIRQELVQRLMAERDRAKGCWSYVQSLASNSDLCPVWDRCWIMELFGGKPFRSWPDVMKRFKPGSLARKAFFKELLYMCPLSDLGQRSACPRLLCLKLKPSFQPVKFPQSFSNSAARVQRTWHTMRKLSESFRSSVMKLAPDSWFAHFYRRGNAGKKD